MEMYVTACICIMHGNMLNGKRFRLQCLFRTLFRGIGLLFNYRDFCTQLVSGCQMCLFGWTIVFLEDHVFFFNSCIFFNVLNTPRKATSRQNMFCYKETNVVRAAQ